MDSRAGRSEAGHGRFGGGPLSRKPLPGLVHHSRPRIQFASIEYMATLEHPGIVPSTSQPANPSDNAGLESFVKALKRDEIYANEDADLKHLRGYIEGFIEQYHSAKGTA